KHAKPFKAPKYDDDQSTQLESQLADLGLAIKDMTGDGNCLFRALSDQIHGSPARHGQVRSAVCDQIAANADLYAPFIDDGSLASHVASMRRDGTYGGNMEVVAAARMARVDIAVHQAGLPVWVVESGTSGEGEGGGRGTIHIAYHSWEHYSSVRNADGPVDGPPCIRIVQQQKKEGGKEKMAWERDEGEPPSNMETLVMKTTGVTDLGRVRALFAKARGDPGRVMDILYDEME
ncbi:hypothetical protein BC831DRAFT_389482, partial [Entophlyctis helioformis]